MNANVRDPARMASIGFPVGLNGSMGVTVDFPAGPNEA
jgi:hypothetical protein